MKSFLLQILLFSIVPITFLLFIWIGSHTNKPIVEIKERVLILGDSHTEFGLNDTIFTNSFNYSQGGDPFIYSYAKLVSIASASKIDTLLLSVSPVSIGDRERWLHKVNKLLLRFPWEDLMFLFQYNPLVIGHSFNIFDIRINTNNIGGYEYVDRFNLQKNLEQWAT
jgi:hypothetical protein